MATKVLRKIIEIDEEKCNGCGRCTDACAEGALKLVDGKAKLVSDSYCDGLAACIGECPQGALTIVEREATQFDEEAAKQHLHKEHTEEKLPCGCPSVTVTRFEKKETTDENENVPQQSMLGHWPVQLALVPTTAPFLNNADIMLVADCVPFAYAGFHRDFIKDHALLVACPKLDDFDAHLAKLTDVLSQAQVKSLTVVHMEVPCCSGLAYMAKKAIAASGKNIPFKEIVIGVRGDIKAK